MRVSTRFNYTQNIYRYTQMQDAVNRANTRISDNYRKFHEGYDDSTSYSEAMRLDGEIHSFKLVQTAADKAVNYSKNSDGTIAEISKKLSEFKVKLLQSTNEIHSHTSMNAIANDMEQIRNHILHLANTSVNGQFLFSGTAIGTKPFDEHGRYHGNNETIKVVLGAKVDQPYNIPGEELFLGRDSDYKKVITSNNRMVDRRYDISKPESLHYLDHDSKIRDMIGREYLARGEEPELTEVDNFRGEENLPDTYFYISGTKGNGQSVRAKFAMKEHESISALLKRVGEVFGNTDTNQVVNVELTKSGTIHVTDLVNDYSRLNFSMFAATKRCTADEVYPKEPTPEDEAALDGAEDAEGADGAEGVEDAEGADGADGADGVRAAPAMSAKTIEEQDDSNLPWTDLEPAIRDVANQDNLQTLRDLAEEGKVYLLDFCNNNRPMPDGTVAGHNYARTQFDISDQYLYSNVTQMHKDNRIATAADRMIDCSQAKINTDPSVQPHTVLTVDVNSINNNSYQIKIDLTEGCVTWLDDEPAKPRAQRAAVALEPGIDTPEDEEVGGADIDDGADIDAADTDSDAIDGADSAAPAGPSKLPATAMKYPRRIDFTHKVYDPHTQETYRRKSGPEDITFAQLGHIISLFASDCLPDHDIIADDPLPKEVGVGTQLFGAEKREMDALLEAADQRVSAHMDRGHLMFEDCTSTTTNVRISIYDEINLGDQFAMHGETSQPGDSFVFATNSSIVIDEQQIDLIQDLDKMIAAVRSGQYRADNQEKDRQNPGLQGAIARIDHLFDHVNKVHTKIGSIQRAIESASDRALAMQVNIEQVKEKIMGAGPDGMSETLLQLKASMDTFNMVLQASSMINKLSLLDYMR